MNPPVPSSGLLVLGMHRSGTSALSRVLQLCGADIGTRVLGKSAGNEAGHWEDAFAVEVHERLFAAEGTRWDEALGLPADWTRGEAGQAAREEIAAYVAGNRARHRLWVVKDPRLSLFADLWIDAAEAAGQRLGAVLMLRHPLEVAKSLAARDGIAPARGLLLWLEYTLAAAQAMERVPATLITYGRLLEDWRGCVERIRRLPGGEALRITQRKADAVDGFLDGKLRHHTEAEAARLPEVVREVWTTLSGFAATGEIPAGAIPRLLEKLGPVRELVHPLLGEMRVIQGKLWERVARAEAPLADTAVQFKPLVDGLHAGLGAVAQQVDASRAALVEAISGDLQRMQVVTADAVQAAAVREREAELARQIEPRLQAMEGELLPLAQAVDANRAALAESIDANRLALVEAISGDLQRMQVVTAEATQAAAVREREAELVRQIEPRLQAMEDGLLPLSQRLPSEVAALAQSIDSSRSALVEAISGDLRRMQAVTAEATQAAAVREREAELVRQIEPRLQAMEGGLLPLAQAVDANRAALAESIDANRLALVEAISGDLRRMQAVTAEATQAAAVREREAQLVRQIAPRLQAMEGELLPFVQRMPAELAAMAQSLGANRAALVQGISHELQQMQAATTEATQTAVREREADALRSLLPRIEEAVAARTRLEVDLGRTQEIVVARDDALAQLGTRVRELETLRDERQRQIADMLREIHEFRSRSELLEQLISSHSWRMTRPLRALRRLFAGQWTAEDSATLRGLFRRPPPGPPAITARTSDAAQLQGMALSLGIAPQNPDMPDVFVWAVIDWHFRHQRPQHLAQALADKGHRVFYVSNNFVDDPEPGFRVDPLGVAGRLFQVHLHHAGSPAIYFGMPDEVQVERMRSSLAELLKWTGTCSSVSLVQHPYWSDLLRAVPNARVVYDCMDHHAGFENNASSILAAEERIIADADLVIVTSAWLEQELGSKARATALIRNASEFEFFQNPPERVFKDPRNRRVVGYYGAIAEWFDSALIRQVAEAYPHVLVLLVGSDTAGVQAQLADLDNVQFTGEVPYSELPYWLHGMDVCLLPFKVIPLTLATNPVKVYEYLSAGKPVVAVDLPELAQFGELVEIGAAPGEFTTAVGRMLEYGQKRSRKKARQAFAAAQTWDHRAQALDAELSRLQEPRVSVIVLTYNNLAFTQACLSSIEAYSDYQDLEVLVVDNASSDGSREWLQDWAAEHSAAGHARRLILNDDNLGFSAGNNVGLRAATGEFLVILNNDTYATPGWVRTLCAHLRKDPALGLVGPVTNNIGNEARIEIHYSDMAGMIEQAGAYTRAHPGQLVPIRTAAFFCVAMTRQVYEVVGDMDEEFGVGFFEDDDYCRRMERAGYAVACAEDVFVHHHLSASFEKLGSERKRLLFERNKAIYEAKWGEWIPHVYRGAQP